MSQTLSIITNKLSTENLTCDSHIMQNACLVITTGQIVPILFSVTLPQTHGLILTTSVVLSKFNYKFGQYRQENVL